MQKKRLAPEGGRDDQIRRTARVLEIIQQIATAPGHWSRRRLSEDHEVGERMIQKDLELIRYRLGLRLHHDGSGYCFERLPHLPTTTYSFAEALALLAAARAAQALPGINSAELAAAIARLESIFPDELRATLREATEQLPRRAVKAHRQKMLSLLHRALVERRSVSIHYLTGSQEGRGRTRTVEPYALMPYGRSWHLVAFDHHRRAVLQFKLDRVQAATLLEERYEIPAAFNLDAYLGDGWGLMRGAAGEPERVVLLFRPQAGRWVAEEQWHHSQQSQELPDGCVQVEFFVGVTPEMVRWLLYYGPDVRVMAPGWLREAVAAEHQAALESWEALYAD